MQNVFNFPRRLLLSLAVVLVALTVFSTHQLMYAGTTGAFGAVVLSSAGLLALLVVAGLGHVIAAFKPLLLAQVGSGAGCATLSPGPKHRQQLELGAAREVIHSAMAMGGDGSGAGKMARAALDALIGEGRNVAGARHDSDCAVHNEPAMPAGPCDCSAPAAAGTLAKRVTPADIEAEIASEHYFTAGEGIAGRCYRNLSTLHSPHELELLTICVLVLRNGFKVVGVNYGDIDPAKHDPVRGQAEARAEAVEQVWPLLGYELRSKLAA